MALGLARRAARRGAAQGVRGRAAPGTALALRRGPAGGWRCRRRCRPRSRATCSRTWWWPGAPASRCDRVGGAPGRSPLGASDPAPQRRWRRGGARRRGAVARRRAGRRARARRARSGATRSAARALGFTREAAAELSADIALPVLAGATALKGARLLQRRPPRGAAIARRGGRGGVRLDRGGAAAAPARAAARGLRRLPDRARRRRPRRAPHFKPMSGAYATSGVDTGAADRAVGALVSVLKTIDTGPRVALRARVGPLRRGAGDRAQPRHRGRHGRGGLEADRRRAGRSLRHRRHRLHRDERQRRHLRRRRADRRARLHRRRARGRGRAARDRRGAEGAAPRRRAWRSRAARSPSCPS